MAKEKDKIRKKLKDKEKKAIGGPPEALAISHVAKTDEVRLTASTACVADVHILRWCCAVLWYV
jgi:hypothetical protein